MARPTIQEASIAVHTQGEVPRDVVDYAISKVRAATKHASEPVLWAMVRLERTPNPAVERPYIAEASIDLNGRQVRAHLAAPTWTEAVDLMQDRLRRRLEQMDRHWQAQRGSRPTAEPHEWRHLSEPTLRPDYFPRPPEEREIVKRKTFTLVSSTPDEAAFDMETLDHDFHLFTDVATGQDSVIYRSDSELWLAQLEPKPDRLGPTAEPITVSPHRPPRLTEAEAVERLNVTGLPFLFFVNAESDRGNILYHRYDGHYGLITPAD